MLLPQILLSGITAGAVYALVALGFVLIYRGTHVIHFGLGEQVALGAYLVVLIQLYLPIPFWPAIFLALIAAGIFGFIIERAVMRPIKMQPILVQIIATLAVGLAIREGLRAVMGPQAWPFQFLLSPVPQSFMGVHFAWANIAIVIAALLVMGALYVFFAHMKLGRAVLATCQNPTGASLMGIPVPTIVSSIWVMASVLAAIAGILLAPIVTLSPEMGLIGIKGFTVAVLGGFTSLPGAVVGGLILGVIETAAGIYVSTAVKDATTYLLLVLIIIVRPQGLFGALAVKKV
ncbi:branched-chain amino acid ABC transporter permease [Enterovirga sp.]|uniref:branched-chain amino acid ABC transporter permease n=1 Tax=Enterovirga sp. TaxID=2026350 RepID=UPI002605048C|nr:branched-chain amino acid ABC transporter permease [Enterovirga sp.]MDB5591177.1 branched-chain amino acid transporter permease [Enterovirga sp.]